MDQNGAIDSRASGTNDTKVDTNDTNDTNDLYYERTSKAWKDTAWGNQQEWFVGSHRAEVIKQHGGDGHQTVEINAELRILRKGLETV